MTNDSIPAQTSADQVSAEVWGQPWGRSSEGLDSGHASVTDRLPDVGQVTSPDAEGNGWFAGNLDEAVAAMFGLTVAQVWCADPHGAYRRLIQDGRDALNAGRINTDRMRLIRQTAERCLACAQAKNAQTR